MLLDHVWSNHPFFVGPLQVHFKFLDVQLVSFQLPLELDWNLHVVMLNVCLILSTHVQLIVILVDVTFAQNVVGDPSAGVVLPEALEIAALNLCKTFGNFDF
jgi:hypothetical protein